MWNKVISLVGPSKAGKTTSLMYLAGMSLTKRTDPNFGLDQIIFSDDK